MRSPCIWPAGGCGHTFRGELPWRLHRATVDGVRACIAPADAGLTWDHKTHTWGLAKLTTGRPLERLKDRAGYPTSSEDEGLDR